MHSAFMAIRTDIDGLTREGLVAGFPVEESGVGFWWRSIEESTANAYSVATVTVGEEAEIADLGESLGKHVDEEAPDEFVGVESHGSGAVVLFAILPVKGHLAVLKRQQAVVGNGDAVGIAAEVVEDLRRTSEGRFGIDDPFVFAVFAQEPAEGFWVGQGLEI